MTPPAVLAELRDRLAEDRTAGPAGPRAALSGRAAAVLVLFSSEVSDPDVADLDLVIVEKTAHLRKHAGQCAFPGGSVEPQDASRVATALREAREEVGVEASEVELLGVLPHAPTGNTGFAVTPVVAWWPRPRLLHPVDVGEIAAVHHLNVGDLLDPAHRVTWRLPSGHRGPAFVVDDLFIWGFTAFVLDGLFELAGWNRPWDTSRNALVPERFMRRADR